MSEKMKVLLIEPLAPPKVIEIDHTLEAMQELVGGTIAATYPWDDPVAVVVADDGIALGYPANRMLEDYDIILGSFFICGLTEDSFGSLSDALAEKFTEKFHYPEMFMRTMDGKVLCFRLGSDQEPLVIG